MVTAKLGIGPLSSEIIEAAYIYSQNTGTEIMLIASKNQIDHSGGYVNDWNTKKYTEFLDKLNFKYPSNQILVCRDHCGTGFNGIHDITDVYKTIESDIECGFNLIHIDFSNESNPIPHTHDAINFILKNNPQMYIEIGTEENTGTATLNISAIEEFTSYPNIVFWVMQTGSLVKEDRQVGNFNIDLCKKISNTLHEHNFKFKEHNGDYLSVNQIQDRSNIIDAINIAPEFGIIQTDTVLYYAELYNVNTDAFLQVSYDSQKWKKWILNNQNDKYLCSRLSAHYIYTSYEYQKLIDKIEKHTDIRSHIINKIIERIYVYERNLKTMGKRNNY